MIQARLLSRQPIPTRQFYITKAIKLGCGCAVQIPAGRKRLIPILPMMLWTERSNTVSKISEAVIEAWNNRKSAYMANEFGRAVVGHCRRVVYDDGTSKMWAIQTARILRSLKAAMIQGLNCCIHSTGIKT